MRHRLLFLPHHLPHPTTALLLLLIPHPRHDRTQQASTLPPRRPTEKVPLLAQQLGQPPPPADCKRIFC